MGETQRHRQTDSLAFSRAESAQMNDASAGLLHRSQNRWAKHTNNLTITRLVSNGANANESRFHHREDK